MIERDTVGRLIARLVTPILLLMMVLGILGVIGVYRTNLSVNRVADEVAPGEKANRDFMQLMTDAETGVRGWVIDGQESALAPYRAALRALPDTAAELRKHDHIRPDLKGLVARQEELVEQWQVVYARPRLADAPGATGYDPGRFAEGKAVFDDLRAVNVQIDDSLEAEGDEARHRARLAYRRAIIAMVTLTLLAALLGWFLGRRLRRRVGDPLSELERTVSALAAGDTSARAPVSGPREITAVARAFNVLAAESERGQQVEAQTRSRLLDLDQAKTDFVSNVSHELRTPLTSIRGYLELLRDEMDDPDPGTVQMWDVVERNVGRLSVLVEDLLSLSNAEARHTTLTEVDLAAVVEDVVMDLRIAATNRGIRFVVDVPDVLIRVLADKTQLSRAILNVVSNAVKFSLDDGNVEVRLRTDGEEATLTVRDDGIGIPSQDLDRLGSRFFRGSNAVSRQIGGTGLGVRMVQVILARHGGRVSFESVENEFTLVTIHLPVRSHGRGANREENDAVQG
ncbi:MULTISPECIES: ATP-binding protein [unclassified Nocardioides]|uniref:ATP-binding protein n=1 Tax=unclassified Nocardioides TaxID=2615069 RepID=UPI0006F3950F|nr:MULTISPECIES: ATP-binding protein [unclassified Nocardioides]KQY54498.1 hypothetical protein ASD30_17755 [Nocardioides sp. Root140]KRF19573.1 hypothetical protein ASH02_23715 [Nocardioides sp. Soil796]